MCHVSKYPIDYRAHYVYSLFTYKEAPILLPSFLSLDKQPFIVSHTPIYKQIEADTRLVQSSGA